jgi:CDP-diacylglycerol--serine O-phosphatidyltransferase
MNIKKHIPNFLTCCNLFCGCLGIIYAFDDTGLIFGGYKYQNLIICSQLIFLACLFDFFDGFAARLLKVSSPIGKELDSLADVVTFGVLPGLILFKLIYHSISYQDWWYLREYSTLPYIGLIIPIFSALRLAKFNIDTRQSDSFIGVPTPANAILIASFPIILNQDKFSILIDLLTNPFWLIAIAFVMSFLLVAELPLFALKFKNFKWAYNQIRFSFLIASLLLIIILTWTAIPLIIILYILLSVIENKIFKQKPSSKSIHNA